MYQQSSGNGGVFARKQPARQPGEDDEGIAGDGAPFSPLHSLK
jgi:hypothetical protein